jgi:hypothetical protein
MLNIQFETCYDVFVHLCRTAVHMVQSEPKLHFINKLLLQHIYQLSLKSLNPEWLNHRHSQLIYTCGLLLNLSTKCENNIWTLCHYGLNLWKFSEMPFFTSVTTTQAWTYTQRYKDGQHMWNSICIKYSLCCTEETHKSKKCK